MSSPRRIPTKSRRIQWRGANDRTQSAECPVPSSETIDGHSALGTRHLSHPPLLFRSCRSPRPGEKHGTRGAVLQNKPAKKGEVRRHSRAKERGRSQMDRKSPDVREG